MAYCIKNLENFIECPFFISTKPCMIVCEGMNKDCHTVTHLFRDTVTRNEYVRTKCSLAGGSDCPYNQMLMNNKYKGSAEK